MCLILFAYRTHPRYRLILAANRDEFYIRPTAPLAFWTQWPQLLAGRDLQGGGTWLGVSRSGRLAALTNYRDPTAIKPGAPSRGGLVESWLSGTVPAQTYLEQLHCRAEDYNGFNLLLGDTEELWYYGSRAGAPQLLPPGVYGLSNQLLDTPWPKVVRGKQALTALLDRPELAIDDLFALLADQHQPPDEQLPDTGVGLELERRLAPLFIASPNYGTRCSTALLWEEGGLLTLAERQAADGSVQQFQLFAL